LPFLERTVLINMFDNVIAEKSNKRLFIFTRTNKLFPVRNNSTENNVQGRIVVKSPDTDVLVLMVNYFPKMKNTSEFWFQTGLITSTKDCRRSKVESLTDANFTRNLFRSIWHRFDFPFGSYSLDISFRLRSTESSMPEHSIRDRQQLGNLLSMVGKMENLVLNQYCLKVKCHLTFCRTSYAHAKGFINKNTLLDILNV
jgi:hypothetical protein